MKKKGPDGALLDQMIEGAEDKALNIHQQLKKMVRM
jgi:hypothetical protein